MNSVFSLLALSSEQYNSTPVRNV